VPPLPVAALFDEHLRGGNVEYPSADSAEIDVQLEGNLGRWLAGLRERRGEIANWTRVQFFRLWTATTVIILFGLAFWYVPEALTWWQKTVLRMIENVSEMLPYPWSNRVEYIMINFGASIWLQFALAIVVFRVLMWPIARWWRRNR
jgi:hypothetical protein